MDTYEISNAKAEQRENAQIGCDYVASITDFNWFRWNGSKRSGSWERGVTTENAHYKSLQVYTDGEWHNVAGFGYTTHRADI